MSGEKSESVTKAEVDQAADVLDSTPAASESSVDEWLSDHDLEAVSEDDLRGIEEEGEEEPDDSEDEDENEESEEESEEDDEESEEEESEPPPSKDSKKPPKGFVPTKAVQEVRQENRYLKEQIKALEEKFESIAAKPKESESEEKDDFKVLSKEELKELYEEDPREAMAYMLELQEHKEKEAAQEREAQIQQYETARAQQLFTDTAEEMEKLVPGIFDEDSGVQEEFVEFAESIGFEEDLFYLTSPETKVIPPGSDEPVYLGKQAAKILGFIANLKDKINGSGSEEKEQELRKQIEAEVLQKIKKNPGKEFKSLSDIPTAESGGPKKRKRTLSEAEFARLSESEQEEYLSGA